MDEAAQRTPLHEFISQLRRYDGTTNAAEIMTRFLNDIRTNRYDLA